MMNRASWSDPLIKVYFDHLIRLPIFYGTLFLTLTTSINGCRSDQSSVEFVSPSPTSSAISESFDGTPRPSRTPQSTTETPIPSRTPTPRPTLEVREGYLPDLLEMGYVQARAQGINVEELSLELKRLKDVILVVHIPAGVHFKAPISQVQDMVSIRSKEVRLTDYSLTSVTIQVACLNLEREIPGSKHTFTILGTVEDEALRAFLAEYELGDGRTSFAPMQAAVWIITGDASYEDLGRLSVYYSRAIDEDVAISAMQYLDEVGIDITQKRIWLDRELLLQGADRADRVEWLRSRMED